MENSPSVMEAQVLWHAYFCRLYQHHSLMQQTLRHSVFGGDFTPRICFLGLLFFVFQNNAAEFWSSLLRHSCHLWQCLINPGYLRILFWSELEALSFPRSGQLWTLIHPYPSLWGVRGPHLTPPGTTRSNSKGSKWLYFYLLQLKINFLEVCVIYRAGSRSGWAQCGAFLQRLPCPSFTKKSACGNGRNTWKWW